MREHGVNSTIVVFGSARVPAPEDAARFVEDFLGSARAEHWFAEEGTA
jgi:hypothetical protein